MKSNILYLTIYLASSLGLLLSSCGDFLEKDPDQRARLDSPKSVSLLLVSAYPSYSSAQFAEVMSDNVADNRNWYGGQEIRSVDEAFWWKDISDENQDTPSGFWSACYEAIATANHALDFIDSRPENERASYNAQYGEALLCRAYSHFRLITLFAKPYNPATASSDLGIPYVTKPEKVVFGDYQRESVATVYDLMQKDIEQGIPLLDESSYVVLKYHFNTIAANAFASKFYLFKQDWTKAVAHASEALGTNPTSILRPSNGARYTGLSTDEFELTYASSKEACNLLMVEALSNWSRFASHRWVHTKSVSDIIYGGTATGGSYALKPNLTYQGFNDLSFMPKYYEMFKKESLGDNTGHPYIGDMLLLGEEVILNRAEAYAMLGQLDLAIADLNTFYSQKITNYSGSNILTQAKINSYVPAIPDVLSPYGYALTGDALNIVKVVVDSRRKEFIHEGHRWYDITRFNIEITHMTFDKRESSVLKKDDLRRVLQIPQTAIVTGLEPNPR
ncbi:hypothetical protein AwDysgo_10950 [Bacteroidales bacterium]|nr:hypothetical protein AwDysgo_10950 [Bacteroidales bacterium]